MVIFHSYVSLPEGNWCVVQTNLGFHGECDNVMLLCLLLLLDSQKEAHGNLRKLVETLKFGW